MVPSYKYVKVISSVNDPEKIDPILNIVIISAIDGQNEIVTKLILDIFQYHRHNILMKLSVLAAVMSVLAILSPSSVEANYCVNCDTFLSCMVLCRNGYNKLQRVDR